MNKKKVVKRQKPKLSAEHKQMRTDSVLENDGYIEKVRFDDVL